MVAERSGGPRWRYGVVAAGVLGLASIAVVRGSAPRESAGAPAREGPQASATTAHVPDRGSASRGLEANARQDGCELEAAAIVRTTREAIARFADPRVAMQEGYRAWGHDFPGMGAHWINPRLAGRNDFDPTRPPLLLYANRDGYGILVGAAFLAMLSGEAIPPGPAFLAHAWHDHSGSLREELFAGDHARSDGSRGFRVVVLHVWTLASAGETRGSSAAGGAFEVQNWTLPFLREGLRPVQGDLELARGLSLARAPEYYLETLRYAGVPERDVGLLEARVESGAEVVRQRLRTGAPGLDVAESASVIAEWRALLDFVRDRWPEAEPGIDRMLHVPRIRLACGDATGPEV